MTGRPNLFSSLARAERAIRERLIRLSREHKQGVMLVTDATGILACVFLAAWVDVYAGVTNIEFVSLSAVTLGVAHLLAHYLGFYQSIIRYIGMELLFAGARVALGSSMALAATAWWLGMTTFPIRLAVVYFAFCGLYLVGSRYAAQHFLIRKAPGRDKVIVYGAGDSGAQVVQAMHGNSAFAPFGFVDDNPALHGHHMSGLLIYPSQQLDELIRQNQVSRVLLAMPTASRRRRREIIDSLEPLHVHVQSVPEFNDLISGKARVDDIREVDVGDLLSRAPVAPVDKLMQGSLLGKSVLVTGAGGSIGSELCRQILRAEPRTIVLFELSEVALYTIDKELRALVKKLEIDVDIVPLLGSVQDQERVHEIMLRFRTETVYHAAAYKHVPMVEQNIIEGTCNNVLGTLNTARAAVAAGVKSFVLVSTDKAVSPTNVMGATKRLAEQVLQALQETTSTTCFSIVRFGNVLESSGSVVPLFREQIKLGGPVTVTHPLIIRYFMTIPEAAQLVIQAGTMAEGGDVFVLDMGEPVKIVDLATRMINLTGLTVRDHNNPDGDIEIEFTGLRPAEKLYEELLIGENVSGTEHPRIMRAEEHFLPYEQLEGLLQGVADAARHMDRGRMREILEMAVLEYQPKEGIKDLLWDAQKTAEFTSAVLDKIH